MKRRYNGSSSSVSKRFKKGNKRVSFPMYKKPWKPIMPYMNNKSYVYKRHGAPIPPFKFVAADISVITNKPLTISFTLSQVQGFADFVALYDQYRIRSVEVKYTPITLNIGNLNAAGQSSMQVCTLASVIDYDDSIDLPDVSIARQYSSCLIRQYGEEPYTTRRKFTPASLVQLYRTLTTTGYSSKYGQWIDVATNDVPHYGMKFLLSLPAVCNTGDTNMGYQIDVQYELEFRNSR